MGASPRPFVRPVAAGIVWACVMLAWFVPPAVAVDPENCLSCHRFRGRRRLSHLQRIRDYVIPTRTATATALLSRRIVSGAAATNNSCRAADLRKALCYRHFPAVG